VSELRPLRELWRFKPGVTYLNHGSFGACPRPVLESAERWNRRLAEQPCEFFQRDSADLLAGVRGKLGAFLGASPADLVQATNATVAGNIIAQQFARSLRPGDQVLTTDHEYGAMVRMWETLCRRAGAELVKVPLPYPIRSEAGVVEALFARRTDRTRLVFASHVTSPTALVLPLRAIVAEARRHGLPVMIDGAHAPGMFPLDLSAVGADWYVGNCHKWLCAPVGSGFLYAAPTVSPKPEPLVIGWGQRPGKGDEPGLWQAEFEWGGTRDYAAFLATADAIDLAESVGPARIAAHGHALAGYARRRLAELTGLEPICPDSPAFYGSMAACPLPPGPAKPLQDALFHRFGIEVPVVEWSGRRFVRVSGALYNTAQEIDRLVGALRELL
jgi:isopenicillin-N epimerase